MTDPRLDPKVIKAPYKPGAVVWCNNPEILTQEALRALDICRAIAEAPKVPRHGDGPTACCIGAEMAREWWEACRALIGEEEGDD